jgi:tryptophanyl-tRNA synthetase
MKEALAEDLVSALAPVRAASQELAAKPEFVREVLREGARRARLVARRTMVEVKLKMGLL